MRYARVYFVILLMMVLVGVSTAVIVQDFTSDRNYNPHTSHASLKYLFIKNLGDTEVTEIYYNRTAGSASGFFWQTSWEQSGIEHDCTIKINPSSTPWTTCHVTVTADTVHIYDIADWDVNDIDDDDILIIEDASTSYCIYKYMDADTKSWYDATGGFTESYAGNTNYGCVGGIRTVVYDDTPEIDTELTATGVFCSYHEIEFELTEVSANPGYSEIYLYKDDYPDGFIGGDTGTSEGSFTYSRYLGPGDYYTQGFYTPDADPETTYGEWLNFSVLNNCTVMPTGTISSENLTHNISDQFMYMWIPGEWNTSTNQYDYDFSTEGFLYKWYEAGLINETEYNAAIEYYENISDSPEYIAQESLIIDNFGLKQHSVDNLEEAGQAVHSNMNVSFGILSNYTAPISYMGAYAIQFFPAPVIDLITAYLIIQVAFLVIFGRKD